jgi:hypothetical protein
MALFFFYLFSKYHREQFLIKYRSCVLAMYKNNGEELLFYMENLKNKLSIFIIKIYIKNG